MRLIGDGRADLLERCSQALTQTFNESLHSVTWYLAPEHVCHSPGNIYMATACAVGLFNEGMVFVEKFLKQLGLSVSETLPDFFSSDVAPKPGPTEIRHKSGRRPSNTKPASKGITLNFHSHHPSSVKRAVVANEFKRAQLCASAEHRAEANQATRTKLTRNNYPSNWTNPQTRRRLKKKPHRPTTFTFNIPYINEKFNANVKHILTKHNIPARLTNSRGRTVRELARRPATTPSRCQSKACPAPGICQRSSVIYKATCRICGLFYVGQTQCKLHDHAREHVTAARERSRSSALGERCRTQHPVPEDADDEDRQPSITFEVLSQHRDILHLHIEEAMAIQSLRPPLNRRDEHLGTGFLV